MSLTFKTGSDKGNEKKEPQSIELYDTPGHVRNICFVQADGKRLFLNYAYLVSGEYSPHEDKIELTFTSSVVEIKGKNLEQLFEAISSHRAKQVSVTEERYLSLGRNESCVVTMLTIK